jgi:hypothetical protein
VVYVKKNPRRKKIVKKIINQEYHEPIEFQPRPVNPLKNTSLTFNELMSYF